MIPDLRKNLGAVEERSMSLWKEFKTFAVKGNAMDLAVGVILGAAFGAIVNSLVSEIIMPPIGLISGGRFENIFLQLNHREAIFNTLADAKQAGVVTVNFGLFLDTIFKFLMIAGSVFLMVRALNRLKRPSPTAPAVAKDCAFCSMSIPIKATRCPHCTSDLTGA